MTTSEHRENMAFEAEARRVAEAIWGLEPGDCQPEHYSNQMFIRELDGIARLRDVTHLMMVTTSTKLEKIKSDVKKLNAAADVEQRRGQPVSKWIITSIQLDAQHVTYARQHGVTVMPLEQFRHKFFDGRSYLQKRRVVAFGSARNLQDNSISISEDEYVELPITIQHFREDGQAVSDQNTPTTLNEVVDRLKKNETLVMMAAFGSGKSLTTREVFLRLEKLYRSQKISNVPIAINLREHWGSVYADEILERHARSIGFAPKENLTVAWRAGICTLLVDGFDEMASQVVASAENKAFMRDARRHALVGVKDLLGNTPAGVGILICGRDHYFDTIPEMLNALGLIGRKCSVLRLGEFTETQARIFLANHGAEGYLPDWLPRKPLLLGYLAHSNLLNEVLGIDEARGFGYIWDQFLTKIALREAQVARALMEPATIRRVLEHLASQVRSTASGTGPITGHDLAEAYQIETGQVAGEGVLMQLQRLPGLTERGHAEGARSFVDEDMLSALQGSAVANHVLSGQSPGGKVWLDGLNPKGVAAATYRLTHAGADVSTLLTSSVRLSRGSPIERQLAADVLMSAIEMSRDTGRLDANGIVLNGIAAASLDLEDLAVNDLMFQDSILGEVILGPGALRSSLALVDCNIHRVAGASSKEGLPPGLFRGCQVQEYDDTSTNAAVLRLDWQPSIKALVTILRKVYKQAGGGREVGALRRGLPSGPVLNAVDEVIQILAGEKVVLVWNDVVHPIRKHTARVDAILHAPNLSNDPIVQRVRAI